MLTDVKNSNVGSLNEATLSIKDRDGDFKLKHISLLSIIKIYQMLNPSIYPPVLQTQYQLSDIHSSHNVFILSFTQAGLINIAQ